MTEMGAECPPEDLRMRYEELRAWATGECRAAAAPRGLALLLRAGLPGWLEAWSRAGVVPAEAAATRPQSRADMEEVAVDVAELTRILAQMALLAARR